MYLGTTVSAYLVLLAAFTIFVSAASTAGMGRDDTTTAGLVGNFGDIASAILIVGFPIAFCITVHLHHHLSTSRK